MSNKAVYPDLYEVDPALAVFARSVTNFR